MNILVCFKVVPDLDMLSDDDWTADSNLRVDVSFVKKILNCFDESALEMTLKLSDYSEGFNVPLNLTALTIGDKKLDAYLKTLNALRFDKTVRIENYEDIRFLPESVAAVISKYAKEINPQDVIILGRQSGEGDNAKTPLLVAEMLGWPCITQVINIEPYSEDCLRVTNMVDGGKLTQIVKTPCVLSIGNAPNSYIRVPTLRDRMKYGKRPIDVLDIGDLNIKALLLSK
ncbi:MAG: electron transfer flavoprotein subunit beta/FixA family protein, partial [Desulfobacterales bacterium]|nr:electron transfer flavoprotein subunit beta/FixA family protein [Desulfobacterales bacterium]